MDGGLLTERSPKERLRWRPGGGRETNKNLRRVVLLRRLLIFEGTWIETLSLILRCLNFETGVGTLRVSIYVVIDGRNPSDFFPGAIQQCLAADGAIACFSSSLFPFGLNADRAPQLKASVMSLGKRSEFQKEMDVTLKPKLVRLGFQEIVLKDCIHPEVLFNNGRLWFGASWDYRDQYLEVDLGHLYWFKDVMPRVIVLGDYGSYSSQVKSLQRDAPNYIRKVAEVVRDSIENAIETYNARYEEILAERKNPKNLKYRAEFFSHLGGRFRRMSWHRLRHNQSLQPTFAAAGASSNAAELNPFGPNLMRYERRLERHRPIFSRTRSVAYSTGLLDSGV
jgi:hypothetical protein